MPNQVETEEIVARTPLAFRILLATASLAACLTWLYLIPATVSTLGDVSLLALAVGGTLFFAWATIDILRAKIIVNDVGIERVVFRRKRIEYSQIDSVSFFLSCMTVRSSRGSIKLATSLDRQEEAMVTVCRALKERTDFKITGDKTMAERYLGRTVTK